MLWVFVFLCGGGGCFEVDIGKEYYGCVVEDVGLVEFVVVFWFGDEGVLVVGVYIMGVGDDDY